MGKKVIPTEWRKDPRLTEDTQKKRLEGLIKKALELANITNTPIFLVIRIEDDEDENGHVGGGGIYIISNLKDPTEFLTDVFEQHQCKHFHYVDLNDYKKKRDDGFIDCDEELVAIRSVDSEPLSENPRIQELQKKIYPKNYDVKKEYYHNLQFRERGIVSYKEQAKKDKDDRNKKYTLKEPVPVVIKKKKGKRGRKPKALIELQKKQAIQQIIEEEKGEKEEYEIEVERTEITINRPIFQNGYSNIFAQNFGQPKFEGNKPFFFIFFF
jgi:hypothetical protein